MPSWNTGETTRTWEIDEDSESESCPECRGSVVTKEDVGETICGDCGLVIADDRIDRGPEWRSFSERDKRERSRVGAPMTDLLHDKGLSTIIDWRDVDASGRRLGSEKRERIHRLRLWDERFRTRDGKERNLKQAIGEIQRMASALGLPKTTQETASVVYRQALDSDLLPGRSIEGVATATLYAAARQAATPRSLDEMATVSRIDRLELARTHRYLVRELDLELTPADPVEYLPRFASELDITDQTERRARELLITAKDEGIFSGKSPVGLAAAGLYAAALLTEESVTQSEISETAGVSEVTIRNRYKELIRAANGS